MVVLFDLDGTLADCEHRRHFIDPKKNPYYIQHVYYAAGDLHREYYHKDTKEEFKPNWRSFHESCLEDDPIQPVIKTLNNIFRSFSQFDRKSCIEIWSGRCESVREKTEWWFFRYGIPLCFELKMRPVGDSTPDDQLKERWLDEAIADGKTIDYVFDNSKSCRNMWRRHGIFVFNCAQHDDEF